MSLLGTVASSPAATAIMVDGVGRIYAGMDICFVSPTGNARVGVVTVDHVNHETGIVHFASMLNASVPAVAEGDSIHEYEQPCTRCRCKRCTIAGMF